MITGLSTDDLAIRLILDRFHDVVIKVSSTSNNDSNDLLSRRGSICNSLTAVDKFEYSSSSSSLYTPAKSSESSAHSKICDSLSSIPRESSSSLCLKFDDY